MAQPRRLESLRDGVIAIAITIMVSSRPRTLDRPKCLLKIERVIARVIITDKLKSYAAAKREILPITEHRTRSPLEFGFR
ncbi:hypothetical protein ACFOFO_04740 [Undibacterium arcticum]|uniref:Transposase n=2 Tax=Undibacterium arcticum TaxID=1762892 RepID=A0ABV7EZ89_9BURK